MNMAKIENTYVTEIIKQGVFRTRQSVTSFARSIRYNMSQKHGHSLYDFSYMLREEKTFFMVTFYWPTRLGNAPVRNKIIKLIPSTLKATKSMLKGNYS